MRSSIYLAVLAATLTTAVPLASPQGIDFDVYEEALADLLPDVDVPAGDVTQVVHYSPSPVQASAVAGYVDLDFCLYRVLIFLLQRYKRRPTEARDLSALRSGRRYV